MEITQGEWALIYAALSITMQEYLDIKETQRDLSEEDMQMVEDMILGCENLMQKLEPEITKEESTPRPSWGKSKP